MKAVVLVAGYATRLYPLTKDRPKGLLPIGGRPIMDYLFDQVEKIDEVDEAILVSNAIFYDQFAQWAEKYDGRVKISVVNDGTTSNEDRLGALGDLKLCIDQHKIDEDLMVLVSDNYLTNDNTLLNFYNFYKEKGTACVLGSKFDDLEYLGKNFGVAVLDDQNRILNMEEKPGIPKSDVGIWASYIYPRETVAMLGQYLEEGNKPDAPGNFPSWLYQRQPVHAYLFEGQCYDIGTPEIYYNLDKMLTDQHAESTATVDAPILDTDK